MKIEIKRWDTGESIYTAEDCETIKAAVEMAVRNGASLDGASLVGARLDRASLDRASLVGARLDRASLDGASLDGASLDGASLDRAHLDGASLDAIRDDLFLVFDAAPNDVEFLRLALVNSEVDGSVYEGECACLVGTIAHSQKCSPSAIPGLPQNLSRPAERWFLAINPHCSVKHPVVAITLGWIDEWQKARAGK